MERNRVTLLLVAIGVLCLMLVWNVISGWGLVTVHVRKAPLSKVKSSIERQGGIKIETNVDLATRVDMDVDRVSPAKAVSVLADRLDGSWRLIYVVAESKGVTAVAIEGIKAGERRPKDWKSFGTGWRGMVGWLTSSDIVPDPRDFPWNFSPMDDHKLQAYLDQFAQKTGISVMVPEGWNPEVVRVPKNNKAKIALPELAKSVGGTAVGFFYVGKLSRNPDGEIAANDRPPQENGDGRSGRPEQNPEWAKERFNAQIAMLPPAEQQVLRTEQDEMQKRMQEVRNLSPEERQARFAQEMNDPARQAKMEDRMLAAQDRANSKKSPEQRAERYRAYVARKQAAIAAKSASKP